MSAARRAATAAEVVALAGLFGLAACDGAFVDPLSDGGAGLTVSFSMSSAAGGDAQAYDRADAARIRLQRRTDATVVADQVVSLASGTSGTEARIEVELTEDSEVFDLTAQLTAAGQVLFTASSPVTMRRGQTTSAELTLQPVVASVVLSRTSVLLSAIGETLALGAYATFATGDTVRSGSVQWSSQNQNIVTVSAAGLLTARGAGTTQVVATIGAASGTLPVEVRPVASTITVTPAGDTLAVGEVLQLAAVARDANGNVLVRTFAWTSSNAGVAAVDAAGKVTATAAGSATITATADGKTGSSSILVVLPPVTSVTIVPGAASVQVGSTVQLQAELRTATGQVVSRPVTWVSGNTAIATVSATGLVSGVAAGTVTITARSESASGTAQITVVAPVLEVSPSSLAFTGALGGANPASQSIAIANTGGGTLTWSVSDDAAWLSLNPTSGSNAGTVTAGVNTAGLGAGTYGATITVTGNTANSPRTVAVTLTVTSQPAIGVSPTALAFSGPQGGSNPASQTLAISNTGGGTLSWTVSDDAAWLTVSPPSGTNSGTTTVTASTVGLAPGSYGATITITGNASNSPRTVPVTLTVIATTGQVQGRVSTVGGAPLASAQVLINELQRGATTNATGNYVFTGVPPGTYGMTASLSGYLAQSVSNVVVTAGQTATVNFSLTALPPPPAGPSALVASAVSNQQINLSWMDLSSNETGFRVESCTGANCTNFAVIATLGANVQSYQHTGLSPGTTYQYRVQAYNLGGSSAYSQIASASTLASTPVLTAGSYSVWTISDSGCSLYGPTRLGTSFRVVFSFTDADGDVSLSSSAVGGSWVFSPSGASGSVGVTYRYTPSVTGSGSSGTVTTYQCYVFGSDAYVDVTMTMTDSSGRTGRLAPIRITKPAGAN